MTQSHDNKSAFAPMFVYHCCHLWCKLLNWGKMFFYAPMKLELNHSADAFEVILQEVDCGWLHDNELALNFSFICWCNDIIFIEGLKHMTIWPSSQVYRELHSWNCLQILMTLPWTHIMSRFPFHILPLKSWRRRLFLQKSRKNPNLFHGMIPFPSVCSSLVFASS